MKDRVLHPAFIKEIANETFPQLQKWRRHLHAHPELSFQEFKTTEYIIQELRKLGVETIESPLTTGLVAIIQGELGSEPVLALRADIDALPIHEANTDKSYCSQNEGVMHACGHDAHTTSLLGTAAILMQTKEHWGGTVKLLFQPGEEKLPGGASLMIDKGVLENPKVESVIGQHVFPFLKSGQLGFKSGMYMASADEIYLTVKGRGGHAALPEKNVDPVSIGAYLITALQQVVSRNASPKDPTVLSFGKFIADGATNVIPDEVKIAGTFRAMNEEWRFRAHKLIEKMAEETCRSMGAECEVEIKKGYPFLLNDPQETEKVRRHAKEYLGEENVIDLDIWMGGEDFAFYTHHAPSCFYRFGTSSQTGEYVNPVHNSSFDIDETSLITSAGFMAWTTISSCMGY